MNNSKEKNDAEKKDITVIVNGREKVVPKGKMTFTEMVALAEGLPSGKYICYTITYRRGDDKKPEGTLVEGETINVKEGMIFNVTATDKS